MDTGLSVVYPSYHKGMGNINTWQPSYQVSSYSVRPRQAQYRELPFADTLRVYGQQTIHRILSMVTKDIRWIFHHQISKITLEPKKQVFGY